MLQLIVSMLFCMVDWCLRIPIPILTESVEGENSCLHKVFRVSTMSSDVLLNLSPFITMSDFYTILMPLFQYSHLFMLFPSCVISLALQSNTG